MCSITMAILILGFIAVTPWLSKRYAAKWLYYAWLIIVLGLIIPYRLHLNTPLAQMNPVHTFIQSKTPLGIINYASSPSQTSITESGLQTIDWSLIACCIWLLGTLTFIVYNGLKHYRFISMVKRWGQNVVNPEQLQVFHKAKKELGISQIVGLQLCPCISSPMMIGIFKPLILLPGEDSSLDELALIFRHELIHLKRKDLLYKALIFLASAIHWFNPVVYLMTKAIATQCEISCDAEVVDGTNLDVRQQYSEAIIGVIRNQSRMQTSFSTNFYGGKKGMKNRIFSIMDTTKKKTGVIILCSLVIGTLGIGAAFGTGEASRSYSHSADNHTYNHNQEEHHEHESSIDAKECIDNKGQIDFSMVSKLSTSEVDKLDRKSVV